MAIRVANNAFGILAVGISDSDTSITLESGDGVRFPTLGAGDYFYATLIDVSNQLEIVRCTARTGDVLTVERAEENTTARSYSAGDRLEIRLTAQTFLDASADTAANVTYDNSGSGLTSTNVKDALDELDSDVSAKQDALISGTNIKTINSTSLLGAGDIAIDAGGGNYAMEVFTAPGTWTKPADIKAIKVTVVGGGGGGGGVRGRSASGPPKNRIPALPRSSGGGGGGGAAILFIPAPSIPGPQPVTRGAGGPGGPAPGTSNSNTTGGTGGTSSFGSFASATGGTGGALRGNNGGTGTAPGGAAIGGGGGGGGNPSGATSGSGGPSIIGGGGRSNGPGANGVAGRLYGGGGSGGHAAGATAQSGGAGAVGVVIVEEFY